MFIFPKKQPREREIKTFGVDVNVVTGIAIGDDVFAIESQFVEVEVHRVATFKRRLL